MIVHLADLTTGNAAQDAEVESVPVVLGGNHRCSLFCIHVAVFIVVELNY